MNKRKKLPGLAGIAAALVTAIVLACREDAPTPPHRHSPPDITLSGPSFNTAFPGADSLTCSGYPTNEGSASQTTKRIWLEAQAWWDSTGADLKETAEDGDGITEGEHIHLGACWPIVAAGADSGKPKVVFDTSAQLVIDIRQLVHATAGQLTQPFKVMREGTVVQDTNIHKIGPTATEATGWLMNYPIDFSGWGQGRREVRLSARMKAPPPNPPVPAHAEFFNSTAFPLCVDTVGGAGVSSTPCLPAPSNVPSFNTDSVIEGKGWYAGFDYKRAWFKGRLPIYPISGNWTFRAKLEQSGPVGIFIDPDFHGQDPASPSNPAGKDNGTVVTYGPNAGGTGPLTETSYTIDTTTLSNGFHRLALVSCDVNSACGVLVIGFTVAN